MKLLLQHPDNRLIRITPWSKHHGGQIGVTVRDTEGTPRIIALHEQDNRLWISGRTKSNSDDNTPSSINQINATTRSQRQPTIERQLAYANEQITEIARNHQLPMPNHRTGGAGNNQVVNARRQRRAQHASRSTARATEPSAVDVRIMTAEQRHLYESDPQAEVTASHAISRGAGSNYDINQRAQTESRPAARATVPSAAGNQTTTDDSILNPHAGARIHTQAYRVHRSRRPGRKAETYQEYLPWSTLSVLLGGLEPRRLQHSSKTWAHMTPTGKLISRDFTDPEREVKLSTIKRQNKGSQVGIQRPLRYGSSFSFDWVPVPGTAAMGGHKYIMCAVEHYSSTTKSESSLRKDSVSAYRLMEHTLEFYNNCHVGPAQRVVVYASSDDDKSFNCEIIKKLMSVWRVTYEVRPPRNPSKNSGHERPIGDLREMTRYHQQWGGGSDWSYVGAWCYSEWGRNRYIVIGDREAPPLTILTDMKFDFRNFKLPFLAEIYAVNLNIKPHKGLPQRIKLFIWGSFQDGVLAIDEIHGKEHRLYNGQYHVSNDLTKARDHTQVPQIFHFWNERASSFPPTNQGITSPFSALRNGLVRLTHLSAAAQTTVLDAIHTGKVKPTADLLESCRRADIPIPTTSASSTPKLDRPATKKGATAKQKRKAVQVEASNKPNQRRATLRQKQSQINAAQDTDEITNGRRLKFRQIQANVSAQDTVSRSNASATVPTAEDNETKIQHEQKFTIPLDVTTFTGDHDQQCAICNEAGNLMLCHSCPRTCHYGEGSDNCRALQPIDPNDIEGTEKPWHCVECISDFATGNYIPSNDIPITQLPIGTKEIVGHFIIKNFGENGIHVGEIKSYNEIRRLYQIEYKDGDTEELTAGEVTDIGHQPSDPTIQPPPCRFNARRARFRSKSSTAKPTEHVNRESPATPRLSRRARRQMARMTNMNTGDPTVRRQMQVNSMRFKCATRNDKVDHEIFLKARQAMRGAEPAMCGVPIDLQFDQADDLTHAREHIHDTIDQSEHTLESEYTFQLHGPDRRRQLTVNAMTIENDDNPRAKTVLDPSHPSHRQWVAGIMAELVGLDEQDVFDPVCWDTLTYEQKRNILTSKLVLKAKRCPHKNEIIKFQG